MKLFITFAILSLSITSFAQSSLEDDPGKDKVITKLSKGIGITAVATSGLAVTSHIKDRELSRAVTANKVSETLSRGKSHKFIKEYVNGGSMLAYKNLNKHASDAVAFRENANKITSKLKKSKLKTKVIKNAAIVSIVSFVFLAQNDVLSYQRALSENISINDSTDQDPSYGTSASAEAETTHPASTQQ